ncbi:SFRP2 protein, partial [Amia calva]|nr:SFRP2 protein [Amia calva]
AMLFPVVVCVLLGSGLGFDLGQSTRCVAIPPQLAVCQDVGYSEMRLPNYLGHRSLGCHPQAQAFLCSLIAPVCLDTFIQPCHSLCLAVRDSCAPVLACWGQLWPDALDCDRFPDHEEMCLTPASKQVEHIIKVFPQPGCQDCPAMEEHSSHKTVLDALCQNDFAVKVLVSQRRLEPEFTVEGRVEFVHQGPLLPFNTHSLLQQWLLLHPHCAPGLARPSRTQLHLLVGVVQPDGMLVLSRVFPWHKRDAELTTAVRKWKHHKC